MAGVDLGYDSDGLRHGDREALGAGEVAAGDADGLTASSTVVAATGARR